MATMDTLYEVWYKRQVQNEGETPNICFGVFESLKEAREACLMLAEEEVKIWKIYKISEHLEDYK